MIVAARPEAVEAALEALIGEATVETRASAETQEAPPLSAAARSALAAWTGTDLWAAAVLVGGQATFVSASTEPAHVFLQQGDKTLVTGLYRTRSRLVLDALVRSASKAPFAYALDGDVLLVVQGDPAVASAGFVRTLLGGARAAEVGVAPPL